MNELKLHPPDSNIALGTGRYLLIRFVAKYNGMGINLDHIIIPHKSVFT